MRLLRIIFLLLWTNMAFSQSYFYDLNSIQKIEIFFANSNWDYQLDTAKIGTNGYILAQKIIINGVELDSVGVKYKGNSSYDSTYVKNPWHIELNYLKDQAYQEFTDIKLSNAYMDPSLIREVLSYKMLSSYMDAPQANFAFLYVNNQPIGLYSNVESINKAFINNKFGMSNQTFIKCSPTVIPGPTTKSSLRYLNSDSSSYFNHYELKSDMGWHDLVALSDSVTNSPNNLSQIIDIDRFIWMLAFNNIFVNLDSYTGAFCQNYYLYKDNNQRFSPIVWDLNMSIGGFPYLGAGATSMMSLSVNQLQELDLKAHYNDPYWPMIKNILSNERYEKQYMAHAKTMVNDYLSDSLYLTSAQQLISLIDSFAFADSNLFFSYNQFNNSLLQNVQTTSYTIPAIANFLNQRTIYLKSTSLFQFQAPLIHQNAVSQISPALNASFDIIAKVENNIDSLVFLKYRFDHFGKFQSIRMYDDGNHGDSLAGDGIYGASVVMISNRLEYYFYAENAQAAYYLPTNAEHNFFIVKTNSPEIQPNKLVINEIMAKNKNYEIDETGENADWVELYNNSSETLNLGGCYLSDSYSNKVKFRFTENTTLLPHGFLVVFCDQDPSTPFFIHANFSLSGQNDELILCNSEGKMIDSISFSNQIDDVSFGRCPDGNGSFGLQYYPSFLSPNCAVGLEEISVNDCKIFPNPTSGELFIEYPSEPLYQIIVFNQFGQELLNTFAHSAQSKISLNHLTKGLYFIKIVTNTKTVTSKIIKL